MDKTAHHRSHKKPNRKLLFILPLSVGGICLVAVLAYRIYTVYQMNEFKNKIIPAVINKVNKQLQFKILNVKDTNGVYEFDLTITTQNNKKYTSYITKDGKIIFYSGEKVDNLGTNSSVINRSQ